MASTDPDELHTVLSEQRRELMAAQVLESDLDLAFRLQMQEAITASLSLHPSNSTSTSTAAVDDDDDDVFNFATLQTEELSKFEQETFDRKQCLAEFNKIRDDFHRQIHDRKVASDILVIPEEEWREHGDFYEKPYGEGSSSANADSDEVFRVYSKGLVSDEIVQGRMVVLAAIGVAICDSRDNVIFELRKPLVGNGKSRQGAEVKALIEGLRAAFDLDLKRVTFFVDYHPLFQFVTGRWPPKQRKIATLVNQVSLLQRKFTHCNPSLVARNDIKFAFKLARDAIVSQITGPTESSGGKNLKETCVICLEDSDVDQMFLVDGCLHRYCFSCMKQHVEVKLLHGMVP
ncbi:hypothetical protein L1049_013562 [Liquidambar formosana]|uniref:RING-type domain-containing protein n=1 Tax=Liquidambar formosana TaxID=63359 RepID=A0AAP0WU67_LIQFO